MEVHNELGPGFPEEIYQLAMQRELELRGLPYSEQYHVQIQYKGAILKDYYLDLVVDNKVDVELKAVSHLMPIHQSQVLSYLKASHLKLGLLINFGQMSLVHKRIVL
jgi:GxxExxY protein